MLKRIKTKNNKMNIVQKLFLPKPKRIILDFIEQHQDSVQYTRTKETGSFITTTVFIEADNMILRASLQNDIFFHPSMAHSILPTKVSYSFQCTHTCNDNECIFNQTPVICEAQINKKESKFPLLVYNTMMDYYYMKMNDAINNVK